MGTDTDHHFIERMHWDQVARRIGDGAVAILPIGAAAKQHGFHLPLNTDRIQAEWLAGRMAEKIDRLLQDGRFYLIAVGALHCFGDDGLVEVLRARGYAVTPVDPGRGP